MFDRGTPKIPVGTFALEGSDLYSLNWVKLIDELGRKEMKKTVLRDSKVARMR